jgi:hypothetical protein
MRVELTNGADGSALFKLRPEPESETDAQFLAQFPLEQEIPLWMVRHAIEGSGQILAVRKADNPSPPPTIP